MQEQIYFTISAGSDKPTVFTGRWENPTADIDLTLNADLYGRTYVEVFPRGRSEVYVEGLGEEVS